MANTPPNRSYRLGSAIVDLPSATGGSALERDRRRSLYRVLLLVLPRVRYVKRDAFSGSIFWLPEETLEQISQLN
jgi:hypothetical protein